jgi:hypothetical protein
MGMRTHNALAVARQVGMGKTAVVAALVLANPANVKPVSDDAFGKLLTEQGTRHDFKVTVIIVNNTLVQQWADELRKFAPSLKVCMYYGDGKKKTQGLSELRSVDVLLTTPHMSMPAHLLSNMRAHRLVIDEAHLLAAGSTTAQKLGSLSLYQASNVWLVTGAPARARACERTERQCALPYRNDGTRAFAQGQRTRSQSRRRTSCRRGGRPVDSPVARVRSRSRDRGASQALPSRRRSISSRIRHSSSASGLPVSCCRSSVGASPIRTPIGRPSPGTTCTRPISTDRGRANGQRST